MRGRSTLKSRRTSSTLSMPSTLSISRTKVSATSTHPVPDHPTTPTHSAASQLRRSAISVADARVKIPSPVGVTYPTLLKALQPYSGIKWFPNILGGIGPRLAPLPFLLVLVLVLVLEKVFRALQACPKLCFRLPALPACPLRFQGCSTLFQNNKWCRARNLFDGMPFMLW